MLTAEDLQTNDKEFGFDIAVGLFDNVRNELIDGDYSEYGRLVVEQA